MSKWTLLSLLMTILCALISGCTTAPPVEDYALARAALSAASANDSQRYAALYLHEAEQSYRLGEASFKDQNYRNAKTEFSQSREWAEKAENVSRIQKYKSGEVSQ